MKEYFQSKKPLLFILVLTIIASSYAEAQRSGSVTIYNKTGGGDFNPACTMYVFVITKKIKPGTTYVFWTEWSLAAQLEPGQQITFQVWGDERKLVRVCKTADPYHYFRQYGVIPRYDLMYQEMCPRIDY